MVIHLLQLVRWPNVLFVAATQVLVRQALLVPIIGINGIEPALSNELFMLLVAATACITAGGYAINDYFDVRIDRINRPKHVVVDYRISRRWAMLLHWVLTGAGLLIAALLCYRTGLFTHFNLFAFAAISLWFYSAALKSQPVVGTLVVVALAALVPLSVGLFEVPLLNQQYAREVVQVGYPIFNIPAWWITGYACFLALLTLAREVLKDVIDLRGDRLNGRQTIPVWLGVKGAKVLVAVAYLAALALLGYFYGPYFSQHHWLFRASVGLVMVMILVQLPGLALAKSKTTFHRLKWLNVAAAAATLLSMLTFHYSVTAQFQ